MNSFNHCNDEEAVAVAAFSHCNYENAAVAVSSTRSDPLDTHVIWRMRF